MNNIREEILRLVELHYQNQFSKKAFDPKVDWVHYAGRVFDSEELITLVDSSLDFFLTANRYADEFEGSFTELMGSSDAILVNSGSSANLVALTALTSPSLGERQVKTGDERIIIPACFPTSIAPLTQNQLCTRCIDGNKVDHTFDEDSSKRHSSKNKGFRDGTYANRSLITNTRPDDENDFSNSTFRRRRIPI